MVKKLRASSAVAQAPHSAKNPTIISLFNHKGGVSKTTTTFNLGWVLAEQGKRVLIVDGDPQCNLTGMVLGFDGQDDFENFYTRVPLANLCAALQPAFLGQPGQLRPATIQPTLQRNLFVLAGHIDLAAFEAQLAVAFSTGTALPALRNLPGAVGELLRMTGVEHGIDVILIDMSPSIGALNQSLLLCSNHFIVPTSPDYFCYLAINSLSTVLPRWNQGVNHLRGNQIGLSYPLPPNGPEFIGILSQRYRPRSGNPSASFQDWIDRIKGAVLDTLIPALAPENMVISAADFVAAGAPDTPYNIANIADFNSLIAQSQKHNKPIFALTDDEIERVGIILDTMGGSRDAFLRVFRELGQVVANLAHL